MLEKKNSINQIKNIMESIFNRLDKPKERIPETEDREIVYSESNKEKNKQT
jgi:hypothetical protein